LKEETSGMPNGRQVQTRFLSPPVGEGIDARSAENTKFPPKVDTFQNLQNYRFLSKYLGTNNVTKNLQVYLTN
jgi:hypothetical protein